MRRADRLFQILQHLRGGRSVTAAQLAERLEVTPRTIYRDMAHLIGSGVPVEGEAGVGYILRDGFDLPPLMFTHDEIVALIAGARMVQGWGGRRMAASAEEALVKIGAVLPEAARARAGGVSVHAIPMPGADGPWRDRLDAVEEAAETRHRLAILYADEKGARTRRVIRPLGVWYWGRVWTVIGWCELRGDFRMFRIDRIEGMERLERFRPESGRTLKDFMASEQYSDHCG